MASGSCEGDDATVDIMSTSSSPQDDSLTGVTMCVCVVDNGEW